MAYIFGYGSLINKESLENGLKRKIEKKDMKVAFLHGFERVWQATEDTIFSKSGYRKSLFLDIRKRGGAFVNGVLVKVDPSEISNLDIREKNYSRIDVTNYLCPQLGNKKEKVYTYICKDEFASQSGLTIPLKYWTLVCEGAKSFGDKFYEQLVQTTEPILPQKHEIINEDYSFVDSEQNKYSGH